MVTVKKPKTAEDMPISGVEQSKIELRLMVGQAKRVGDVWAKDDIAWVKDATDGGSFYLGYLVDAPYDCCDGKCRVNVISQDGRWEVFVSDLQLEKPKNVQAPCRGELFRPPKIPVSKKKLGPASVTKIAATGKPTTAFLTSSLTAGSNQCWCGCGEVLRPGRRFRQGHDARFHSRVKSLIASIISLKDLAVEVQPYAMAYYKEAASL